MLFHLTHFFINNEMPHSTKECNRKNTYAAFLHSYVTFEQRNVTITHRDVTFLHSDVTIFYIQTCRILTEKSHPFRQISHSYIRM